MRNELAKLGNKLDSMGLFKEANSIDGMLRKISFDKKAESTPDLLENKGLFLFMDTLGRDPEKPRFFPIKDYSSSGFGPSETNAQLINRLAEFLQYLRTGQRQALFDSWFEHEFYGGYKFRNRLLIWIEFANRAAMFWLENQYKPNTRNISINEILNSILSLQTLERNFKEIYGLTINDSIMNISFPGLGQSDFNLQPGPPEENSAPAPPVDLPPVAPEAKSAPTPPVDPWVTYSKKVGDNSMSIKAAWLARAKAKNTDTSYRAYQQWLVESVKGSGDLSVVDVLDQLKAETKAAGMGSARSLTPYH